MYDSSFCVSYSAKSRGEFEVEITPIERRIKGKVVNFDEDEQPRPDVTVEQLSRLPAIWLKDGTASAGNSTVSLSFI